MMVIGYVKQTASRKTDQSKLRWKDENQSSLNSRSFKELLVNKRLHLRRVILTKRERRMSTMSSFLTFFSSSAGIVFFLLSRIFTITISITETSGLFSSSLLYLQHNVCAGLKPVKLVFWSANTVRYLYSFLAIFVLY